MFLASGSENAGRNSVSIGHGTTSLIVRSLLVIALVALLAVRFGGVLDRNAGAISENIVVNGSFEEFSPELLSSGFRTFDSIPGWYKTSATGFEIQDNHQLDPWDRDHLVELSSTAPSSMAQMLVTPPGTVYELSFRFAPRPNTNADQNVLEVVWDGASLMPDGDYISAEGGNLVDVEWELHTFIVVATSDETELEFIDRSEAAHPVTGSTGYGTFGTFLDDVRVVAPSCESTGDGEWKVVDTWDCGFVPGGGNDVTIASGHTVTMTQHQAADNLTIEAGGVLDNTVGHELTIYGDFTLAGDYLITEDGTDTAVFKGEKDQTLNGKTKPVFNNLTVEKEKGENAEKDPELDVVTDDEKDLEVKKKLLLKHGKTKLGDVDLNAVEIEVGATLEGKPGKTKKYKGDKIINGTYIHNDSKDEFTGDKPQKVTGDLDKKLEYYELLIKKQETENEEKSKVEFEKELKVKEYTEVDTGNLTVDKAEFKHVTVKKDGELEGKDQTSTKTYTGDKIIDGKYKHKNSTDKFTGKEEQTVTSEDVQKKQEEIEYFNLLIEKQKDDGSDEKSKIEFEKNVKILEKTDVKKGKLTVDKAEFKDVHIDKEGELEGKDETSVKKYEGTKTVDGTYTHNKSKDEFIGKEDQKVTSEDGQKLLEKIEYYELLIKKEKEEGAESDPEKSLLEFQKKLKVEAKTTIEEGTLKTNTEFGDVVILDGGSLILGPGDDPTEVSGDWTNDGEFESGDGTVIFNGDEIQTISGTSTTSFSNVWILNETVVDSTIMIDGTLKLSAPLSLGPEGEIVQGDNFEVEVEAGGNLGLGCVDGGVKLTGGGWFDSAPGAYHPDPSLTGKANFGLSVHCGAAGDQPTQNVTFNFGPVEFKSTSFDSMIVLGSEATITGHGTVNGTGDYGFGLSAIEGSPGRRGTPNKLRMVIWDRDNGSTVYDAQTDVEEPTDLGGGNITIHR